MESKRLYIGGLETNTTSVELEQRFSSFGVLSDIQFPTRKNDHVAFAYVSILATPPQLKKLISVYNGTKWKGRTLLIDIAKPQFSIKADVAPLEKKISRRTLKKQMVQAGANMSLVTCIRKGWVRTRDTRLVSKVKLRLPPTGRQIIVDPLKYQTNYKKFKLPDVHVAIKDLHFSNDFKEDLSRDSLQETSEISRKRATNWTRDELLLVQKLKKLAKGRKRDQELKIKQSGKSRKDYFKGLEEERKLVAEQDKNKEIAGAMVPERAESHGVVNFESEEEMEISDVPLNGLYDSD